MNKAYRLSGKSDGKGRNGYFKIATIDAWRPSVGRDLDGQVFYVDVYSKRRAGNCGPLRFQLVAEDVKTMARMFKEMEDELNASGTTTKKLEG